jgi:hypothetical protein
MARSSKKTSKAKGAANDAPPKTVKPPKRRGNLDIPGTREVIQEIEDEAEIYVGHRDQRMESGNEETKSAERLRTMLQRHKLDAYRLRDGRLVELVPTDVKVKVRKAAEERAAE